MQKTGDLSRQLFPPEKLATAIVIVLMRLRSITRGIISSGTKCDYHSQIIPNSWRVCGTVQVIHYGALH
jgi:hypothetical protein